MGETPYGPAGNKATMEAALTAHEAFRRLGFPADDIFVAFRDGHMVVMPVCGGLQFAMEVGAFEGTHEEWVKAWDLAVVVWREMTNDECEAMWEASAVKRRSVELVTLMVAKGFKFSGGKVSTNLN